ncbi:CIC11C00000001108 [Sungouiella intermedia]|uniref:CIC11C00000001108 n=1 Tax=Sungouiella intermedia TaxID=45354 RepID=A0A1L0BLK6_9ASCO|nr:CIC11C00000001108 [[Candida] intermedia]
MTQLKGIIAAVPTPLSKDSKSVDLDKIPAIVDRLVDAGVHGIVTTGTTGEFPALTTDEIKSVMKAYVDAGKGRLSVVCGFGCNSTLAAIDLAQYAEKIGADAIMMVPPYYEPFPFDVIYKFFEDVCGSISIPLMYYNLPSATGVHLSANQLRKLGEIKGFDYLKDTSGNAGEQADLLTNPSPNLQCFNGYDTLTFFAFSHGAQAGVWGVASIVPRECVEFYNTLTQEKNLDKAREQWKYLWELCNILEGGSYPAGIKAGFEIIGQPVGPLRLPNVSLGKDKYDELAEILSRRKYK